MGWRDLAIARLKEGQIACFRGDQWYARGVGAAAAVPITKLTEAQADRLRVLWAEQIARRPPTPEVIADGPVH